MNIQNKVDDLIAKYSSMTPDQFMDYFISRVKCTCMTKTPEIRYHKPECKYRNYMDNMKKEQWVKEAYKYLVSITGEWDYPEACMDYCESLYETYVEDELFGEEDCTPKDAVDEDMTYWE